MSQVNVLEVAVVTPQSILFQGKANSVSFPGEKGIFEVLINHKPLLSLLVTGELLIDGASIAIKRGIVKVVKNRILAIVEGPDD